MDLRLSVVVFRYYDRKRKTEHDPVDAQSTLEGQTRILSGGYVSPSIGGDLLRNPKAVPNWRNLIQFAALLFSQRPLNTSPIFGALISSCN
jgi:cobalamin biosynthesis Mg chelatase CobN